MTDFKPGDVALFRVERWSSAREWPADTSRVLMRLDDDGRFWEAVEGDPAAPFAVGVRPSGEFLHELVVIDPDRVEDVARLLAGYYAEPGETVLARSVAKMQAALREFTAPTPPKPDEPTGLYAVVIDDEGNAWHRNHDCDSKKPWRSATGFWFTWDDISVSSDDQIKFRGVTP